MVDINLFTIYLYRIKTLIMNTENNKIIAEFMGKKLPYKNEKGNWEFYVEDAGLINSPNIEDLNRFLGFNYDTDWNWLMEVVEKIETMGADLTIRAEHTIIVYDEGEQISTFCFKTKIQAVYNACVEFIKWYNQKTN